MIIQALSCISTCLLTFFAVDLPVILPISDQERRIGMVVVFPCNARNSESLNVNLEWSRVDQPLIVDGDRVRLVSSFSRELDLRISNVGTADEGVYQCTATNPDGGATVETLNFAVTGTHGLWDCV